MDLLVTTRTLERFGEVFNALSRDLTERLEREGYRVRAVGPGLSFRWYEGTRPWAVILSGGDDIGDDLLRDEFENQLLKTALGSGVPIVGICRGAQLINIALGGTLLRVDAHVRKVSRVSTKDQSFEVTCYHANGIGFLGEGLEVTFRDEEGQIEGFQDSERKKVGLMWHPEREPSGGVAWSWFLTMLSGLNE